MHVHARVRKRTLTRLCLGRDRCLQAGDNVLLPEYGGHTVKLGEDEFYIYMEEDILGRFELK